MHPIAPSRSTVIMAHVLYDAETRSNADDHNRYAVWPGEPVGLKLTTMIRADRTEQFPTV